jgi:hypothetical protein
MRLTVTQQAEVLRRYAIRQRPSEIIRVMELDIGPSAISNLIRRRGRPTLWRKRKARHA